MPLFLILIGAMFIVVAYQGTQSDLAALLKRDFTGQGNFFAWAAAIIIIGLIGSAEKFRPISNAFLVLIFVALIISNKGVLQKFNEALRGLGSGIPVIGGVPTFTTTPPITPNSNLYAPQIGGGPFGGNWLSTPQVGQ